MKSILPNSIKVIGKDKCFVCFNLLEPGKEIYDTDDGMCHVECLPEKYKEELKRREEAKQ